MMELLAADRCSYHPRHTSKNIGDCHYKNYFVTLRQKDENSQ